MSAQPAPSRSQEFLDTQRHRPWYHGGELLERRVADGVDAAEVSEQRPAAHRAEPRHNVELRSQRGATATRPVAGDREAVRLVAHSLHQEQRRAVALDDDRPGAAGLVELLVSLRKPEHWNVREARLAQRLDGRAQLALAAVDEDQVGQHREA